MLDHIKPIVETCVSIELQFAQRDNGEVFHSPHEGFGVLFEEMYEAKKEDEGADKWMNNMLMHIHRNNTMGISHTARMIEVYATNAACEYIQVAAMARKMQLTTEGSDDE